MFFAHHCERKWLGIYMRWSCWTLESENTINTIVRDPLGYNWRRMLVNLFTTINVFAKLPRNIQVHMFSYKFLRLFRRIYVWILFLNYPTSDKNGFQQNCPTSWSKSTQKERTTRQEEGITQNFNVLYQYRFLPEANTIQQMRTVFGFQFRLKIEPFASKRHRHGLSSRCADAPCS